MAKIHTVEWTPGIIAHPTTAWGMRANWWGILGEGFKRRFGRLGASEVLSGIPGSPADHHGVPYSLTEEFVAVYRMHPLLPDDFLMRSLDDDSVLQERTFPEIGARGTRARLEELGMANCLYSFGRGHPGAITLHNYPRFLQNLERPDGTTVDLAATDVLRVRERGVPRYNDFRRLFHLRPARSFEDLNPEHADALRRVYGEIERLDLMPGPLRGAAAEGLRLQRHGLPRLHPHGLAADQERPLPDARLHTARCTPARGSTGSTAHR